MKTRSRIVQASLELFNLQGERSVSTNHIAAFMNISPGNLYYHFANKQQIVAVLFDEYEAMLEDFLGPPLGPPGLEAKRYYLETLMSSTWKYRFLHRDLEHLLESDPALRVRYQQLSQRCQVNACLIFQSFVDAGILSMRSHEVEAMVLNAWIVITSWVRHLSVAVETAQLNEQSMRRGVYQVLMLEQGYVTPPWREAMDALCTEFYVPLNRAPQLPD